MISVIVPVHNGSTYLRRCLAAIGESEDAIYECIVVDDGSTDDTRSVAERAGVTVLSIPPGPRGPAFARNAGAQIAQGDILFFVDADVLIRPDTLLQLTHIFQNDPSLAAVFGSYDEEPYARNFVSQYKNLFHHFVHQQAHAQASTFWSGCGAIRRTVFQRAGGFDAVRYSRPSIEDIELGARLAAAGQRIQLDRTLQVKHLKRWTLAGLIRCDVRDRAIPWTRLIFERRDLPSDLNLRPSQRFSSLVLCAMLALVVLLTPFFPALAALPLLAALSLVLIGCCNWYELQGPRHRIGSVLFGTVVVGVPAAALFVLLQLPSWLAAVLAAGLAAVLLLNWQFYDFFLQRRGALFAAAVVPFHMLYYLYSVAGLILGLLAVFAARRDRTVAEQSGPVG